MVATVVPMMFSDGDLIGIIATTVSTWIAIRQRNKREKAVIAGARPFSASMERSSESNRRFALYRTSVPAMPRDKQPMTS
jgi:hypothetical protein